MYIKIGKRDGANYNTTFHSGKYYNNRWYKNELLIFLKDSTFLSTVTDERYEK